MVLCTSSFLCVCACTWVFLQELRVAKQLAFTDFLHLKLLLLGIWTNFMHFDMCEYSAALGAQGAKAAPCQMWCYGRGVRMEVPWCRQCHLTHVGSHPVWPYSVLPTCHLLPSATGPGWAGSLLGFVPIKSRGKGQFHPSAWPMVWSVARSVLQGWIHLLHKVHTCLCTHG